MKIFKGKILDDGIIVPVSQTDLPIVMKDRELQKNFDNYNKLVNKYEYLNSKQEIYVNDEAMFYSDSWSKIIQSLKSIKLLLHHYKIMLEQIMKSFSSIRKINVNYKNMKMPVTYKIYDYTYDKNWDYRNAKRMFIYILKNYESELNRYSIFINKTEKLKTHLILQQQNTK